MKHKIKGYYPQRQGSARAGVAAGQKRVGQNVKIFYDKYQGRDDRKVPQEPPYKKPVERKSPPKPRKPCIKENRHYVQELKQKVYKQDKTARNYKVEKYITFKNCMDSVPRHLVKAMLIQQYDAVSVNNLFKYDKDLKRYRSPQCIVCQMILCPDDLIELLPDLNQQLIRKQFAQKIQRRVYRPPPGAPPHGGPRRLPSLDQQEKKQPPRKKKDAYQIQFEKDKKKCSNQFNCRELKKILKDKQKVGETLNVALNLSQSLDICKRSLSNVNDLSCKSRETYERLVRLCSSIDQQLSAQQKEEYQFLEQQAVSVLKIRDQLQKLKVKKKELIEIF